MTLYLFTNLDDSQAQDFCRVFFEFLLYFIRKCLICSAIRDMHVVDKCRFFVLRNGKHIHIIDGVAHYLTLRNE